MQHRPLIKKARVGIDTSQEEAFQNTVLRPIIKMKNDLLIAYIKHYLATKQPDFKALNPEKKVFYLNTCFEQDHTLRAELRGIIVGQFDVDEFTQYSRSGKALNKRIINIIQKRIIDHLDALCS